MRTPVRARDLLLSLLAIAGASVAFAADAPEPAQSAPSKEVRAKMATLHEQMAACLRSEKPVSECRAETMKSCQGTMGAHDCSMMGMGQGAMGMHGGKMQGHSESSGDKK